MDRIIANLIRLKLSWIGIFHSQSGPGSNNNQILTKFLYGLFSWGGKFINEFEICHGVRELYSKSYQSNPTMSLIVLFLPLTMLCGTT